MYGIHGIGKTTLFKKCVDEGFGTGLDIRYIDSRTEVHAYPNLTASLISAFGQPYTEDHYQNHRLLKHLFHSDDNRNVRLVIDELDVYPPSSIRPVWDLVENESSEVGVLFISARSVDYFSSDDDLSSKPTSGRLHLGPLSVESSCLYFEDMSLPPPVAHSLVRLSGGNPTLMSLLGEMYQQTSNTDPLDKENRHSLNAIFSYFNGLWNALEEQVKLYSLFVTILVFSFITDSPRWVDIQAGFNSWAIELNLDGMVSFGDFFPHSLEEDGGDLPSIISPLFMVWLLTEKLALIDGVFLKDPSDPASLPGYMFQYYGIPVSIWHEISAEIASHNSATEILAQLINA